MNKFLFIVFICLIFSACKKEISTKQEDEQELSALLQQIKAKSEPFKCENAADWKFIAYGSKACGGPIGYLPYSTKIDTPAFFSLVNKYGVLQNEFNHKWSIASDCALARQPKSIVCEDGKPKLIY
ncbi:MAG: hypothetical protein V4541_10335 [Bacteroidota bacterium]